MSEPDAWAALRRLTSARIALGRTGVSVPTDRALEFQAAHAAARTAVHEPLDAPALAQSLSPAFSGTDIVRTMAPDRATYLRRPDLGRRLAEGAGDALLSPPADIAVVVVDGLSARAVTAHAAPFLEALLPRLDEGGYSRTPLTVVLEGRVAVGDEIGAARGAAMTVMLIGERPGLSAADSLGVYLTYGPQPGRRDNDRNCISNIREGGLSYEQAAYRAHYLIHEAMRRKLTGVALKDDTAAPAGLTAGSPAFLLPNHRTI
ncbi:MAG: ethanolamine ammonia-lyase subunit EutC [Pseudomonadota bacterium]